MKRLKTIMLLVTTLVFVTACGMTQELDESLTVTKNLDTALTEEKQVMKDLLTSVDAIIPSFDKDMENGPKTGLFVEEEGALYKNYQTRQDLLKEIQAGQKNLNKYKREVERISGKNAVDVNHEQLDLISSSLQIIINNYDSLIMYMKTGFEQEEALYTSLPVDNLEDQGSVINRTYGSVTMVAEEAKTNMSYTLSLVKNYQKDASVPKK